MRLSPRGSAWALAAQLGVGLVSLLGVSCSQTADAVPLRSLESSGKVALLCLDLGSTGAVGYSLEDCQAQRLANKEGGSSTVDNPVAVKLYALVNQTFRGEVALLDVPDTVVVDTDATSPGYNFLPVGEQPVDVVVTPESTAAFVASAEVNRPGIYAIPTNKLLSAPSLLSWPACSLPSAPGAMAMLVAPDAGLCGGSNYAVDTLGETRGSEHPNGDLASETQRPGARKLLVTLPEQGEMLIIDAQALLDRKKGSFDTCPIERRYQLDSQAPGSVDLTGQPDPTDVCPARPAAISSPVCPVRDPQTVPGGGAIRSIPAGLALSGGEVFLADQGAPVIHHYDMADPCNPVRLPPLLPSSFDEPWANVTTSAVAVSPVTSDNKRFLYAIDATDIEQSRSLRGSVMIFDVTDQGTARTPVVRSRPEYFPYSRRDRLSLGAAVQDISFVQQDFFAYDSGGTKVPGIKCDPVNPTPSTPGSTYQLGADFTTGALPQRLRGIFAVAALSSGQIEIIDVDDYDAACRRPSSSTALPDWVTGCDTVPVNLDDCSDPSKCVCQPSQLSAYTDQESSCRVVVRHEVRNRNLVRTTPNLGRHEPSMGSFPQLSLNGVTLATNADSNADSAQFPKLLGPINDRVSDGRWVFTSDGENELGVGDPVPPTATTNFVVADAREPRAAIDQTWALTYEGVLATTIPPRVGQFNFGTRESSKRGLFDSNVNFCSLGIHDETIARLESYRIDAGRDEESRTAFARSHADWLELIDEVPDENMSYWEKPDGDCSYLRCRVTFGTVAEPSPSRSFRIQKAYNDHLVLRLDDEVPEADGNYAEELVVTDQTGGNALTPKCCFPGAMTYRVRGGETWIANGNVSSFLRHTTTASDGHCTVLGVDESSGQMCDTSFREFTGRAYEIANLGSVRSPSARPRTDPFLFKNPNFAAFVYAGTAPSRRDMSFSWTMVGGFQPLDIDVARGSSQSAPQSLVYHPALGSEVLVTDGSLQGVLSVDLFSFVVARNFL